MSDVLGWHFLPDDGKLAHGDGRTVRVGETLTVEPPVVLCERGLHASRRALDALKYAEGSLCCRVRLSGEIREDSDKLVASERTVLGMADATRLLHEFACDVAEEALRRQEVEDRRSWKAIEVKRRWVNGEATDEELAAARAAAGDAAWAAAGAAARAASWAAAGAATGAASWAAAGDAAGAASWAASWAAAGDAQNHQLEERLCALLEIDGVSGGIA